jgi:hypothetical protein
MSSGTGGGFGSSVTTPGNGTANVPFSAYQEKDNQGYNQIFQSITAMPAYRNWSFEVSGFGLWLSRVICLIHVWKILRNCVFKIINKDVKLVVLACLVRQVVLAMLAIHLPQDLVRHLYLAAVRLNRQASVLLQLVPRSAALEPLAVCLAVLLQVSD